MKINEVSQKLKLSKKAIRLYESKGLFKSERMENGYRSYSEETVEILSQIKLLRMIGISISDIKLLFDGFATMEEFIEKRKNEITYEFGIGSEQMKLCESYIQMYKSNSSANSSELTENDTDCIVEDTDILSLGIDIGTTTISFAIVNLSTNRTVEIYNIKNGSQKSGSNEVFSLQDPNIIFDKIAKLLSNIINFYPAIRSIGITGQMHGILYLDSEGNAISDFITWQDKRADIITNANQSYCQQMIEITGHTMFSGFGFATHYYNSLNSLVPHGTYTMCNIADYVAMRLCNATGVQQIHASTAASFGLYDIQINAFNRDAIDKLNMEKLQFPQIVNDFSIIGSYKGILVAIPIGDNQASFFGSVDHGTDCILLNIGTGSQISTEISSLHGDFDGLEVRPLNRNKYILCGCALGGGASYSVLESFFRSFNMTANGNEEPLYKVVNALAEKAYDQKIEPLYVNALLYGKRGEENATGSITGITSKNFTPEALALGFVFGICRELYDYFADKVKEKKYVIASGNAVQKNPVFRRVISDMFGIPVKICTSREEAAVGAALFSAASAKLLKSEAEFSKFIKYEE